MTLGAPHAQESIVQPAAFEVLLELEAYELRERSPLRLEGLVPRPCADRPLLEPIYRRFCAALPESLLWVAGGRGAYLT